MTTKHFIDRDGRYVGGFGEGAEPPIDTIEVFEAPPHGQAIWKNGAWEYTPTPANVRQECARRMAAVVAGYTPEERETWPVQIAEAQAVADGATTAPMLSALAEARGLPLATFAAAVLQVSAATKQATATLLAAQARLLAMTAIPDDYTADKWWG